MITLSARLRMLPLEDRVNPSPVLIDINPGAGGSNPSQFANVGGTLFFAADDGTNGRELWKSDGTPEGTKLVRDIRPGALGSNPTQLTNVNGTLFFRANGGVTGEELWKSDGTKEGTVLVKDINPGAGNSTPNNLTNVNGLLFFTANDGVTGTELWKSDGTEAGTVLVRDINLGAGNSNPTNLTNVNGTLFFRANDGTNGSELWKSDGTKEGTVLVKDIRPGAESSGPSNLTNVNGTLFFAAEDGTNGRELWKSDGTEEGTVLVKDIRPGIDGSVPTQFTNVNGTLFFRANDGTTGVELWKSDGTEAGTVLVKDINPGANNSSPSQLTNVNGTLFFRANDGTNGTELWKSDGTEEGTVLVKDIRPGLSNSNPSNLANVNGTLFFRANDGNIGNELWKSDGTKDGTVLVQDIRPGVNSSNPSELTNVNGVLFFAANDGTNGIELWALRTAQNYLVGSGSGIPATVRLEISENDNFIVRTPFGTEFTGGVRVAHADVNGDGVNDMIVGSGPGIPTRVIVYSGSDMSVLADFAPFESAFTGGIFVAAGDFTGDGMAEVIVTPDQGGGPRVTVYRGDSFMSGTSSPVVLADFFGLADTAGMADDDFRGGARAAVGDMNGDGIPELIVAAGFGGGPRVTIWNGTSIAGASGSNPTANPLANFFAFEETLRDGSFVSAGDFNNDGKADLVAAGGPGGGPRVRIADGAKLLAAGNFGSLDSELGFQIANFFAGDPESRGGVRVLARDVTGDGKDDLITGSGDNLPSNVGVYTNKALNTNPGMPEQMSQFDPFSATLEGGVFVG